MKICTKCKQSKNVNEFIPDKRYKSGRRSSCYECRSAQSSTWKQLNPDKVRSSRLKNKFGIDLTQYLQMLYMQNGVCAICLDYESTKHGTRLRELAVDHDRSCCPGERSCGSCIRGLLCQACNTSIGKFKDDPEILQRAINYLTTTKKDNK
jgi:hypothetical protein